MEFLIGFLIFSLLLIIFLLLGKRLNKKDEFSSQEKILESQCQDSMKYFETVVKSITDGLIIVDNKGYITFVNESCKEILKIEEAAEGKKFIEVVRNIDLMNLLKKCMETMTEEKEEILIKKSGQDIYIFAKAIPVLNAVGEISFLVLILQNITKLKQLENIRRDFIANISHELKTPVTTIKGYAETLLDGAIDDKKTARRFLEIIRNQADRLTALIEDILTLSRIEYGEIRIEKEKVMLDSLVESIFQTLSDKAQKKELYMKKIIPPDTLIFADREKLLQILINLIDNAIKFTEKGGVTVRFFKENGVQTISVEDTGIGIPAEHLPRIGERFYRVDKARSRQLGGTGLGLAIVKHLVSAHGWQLKIESEVGVGTKAKILIPSE